MPIKVAFGWKESCVISAGVSDWPVATGVHLLFLQRLITPWVGVGIVWMVYEAIESLAATALKGAIVFAAEIFKISWLVIFSAVGGNVKVF